MRGIILAGSADFKYELKESNFLDKKLSERVLAVVDVSYGGQSGLVEAMGRSKEQLENMQLNVERQIVSQIFDHLAKNDDLVVYGPDQTWKMIEEGAIETVLIHDGSNLKRLQLNNESEGKTEVKIIRPEQESTALQNY